MATASSKQAIFNDLIKVIQLVKPGEMKELPGYEGKPMSHFTMGASMDEVYPRLYVGDAGAAKNKQYLNHVGVTHVLNTAEGNKFATVDTNAEYYQDTNIKYLGLQLLDVSTANISKYFEAGTNFIEEALSVPENKVLVHCFMGMSRSATIACAYLMIKKNMSAKDSLTTIRSNRSIYPNEGFLKQLAELDCQLQAK